MKNSEVKARFFDIWPHPILIRVLQTRRVGLLKCSSRGRVLVCRRGCGFLIKRIPHGKMAVTVAVDDWLVEAEALLEKKSVNEAVDLLNRIGK